MLPVHGGKAISSVELNIQGDNELHSAPCDNISEKNPYYCELTVLYWAWKNLRRLYPDVKYVGHFHYRRYLAFNESKAFFVSIFKQENSLKDYTLNPAEVTRIVDSGRIIAAKRRQFPYSVLTEYCLVLNSDDYNTLKKVIAEKFPDYYDAFVEELELSNKTVPFNMFIMKWEDFEEYCEWLFAVLAEVDPLIHAEHYDSFLKRTPAMLAERLFGVWLRKNKKKLVYRNIYYYDNYEDRSSMLVSCAKYIFRLCVYLKNELTFKLLTTNVTSFVLKLMRH